MKKFLVLGNLNAFNYKEIFPMLMNGKIWSGPSIRTGARWFNVPDDYVLKDQDARVKDNQKQIRITGVRWITNVPVKKESYIELQETYMEGKYKYYDNYPALNVDRLIDIPYDYEGEIGTPITIMDLVWADGLIHFKNASFKLLGILNNGSGGYDYKKPYVEGKVKFKRILIQKI